jgi:hypothetical protein
MVFIEAAKAQGKGKRSVNTYHRRAVGLHYGDEVIEGAELFQVLYHALIVKKSTGAESFGR